MNRDQSYALIQQTFTQGFDKGCFQNFAVNLLNRIDESKAQAWNNTYVKDAFKNHVSRYERLGTYTSPDNEKLDVLIVHLTSETKLARARTAIRNFVAHHLKARDEKDAALVAFVSPTEKQWRFSYVKMEYATVEKESGKVGVETRLTPARRFSYIVGEGESCHTAQTRFLSLLQDTKTDPKLSDIEEAFSVEAVTKEFFKRYVGLFGNIHEALEKIIKKDTSTRDEFQSKNVNTVDFAKKLMGQIVFLYFLQKKGWLGVEKGKDWGTGPHNFLRRLVGGEYGAYGNYFNDVLEPLFYDTLATDRGHEAWCRHFKCRIPFLNGGLFEPLGGYNWCKTDILLPNRLFTNNDPVEEDITGTGVLDVFDRYNFTVNEAEPLEKEVAIDPEMLGKVFENLIEENRRKGLGAYYTPREIVHYMCRESLINYLDTALNKEKELVPQKDIETFIHTGDQAAHYEAARMSGTKTYKPELPKPIETHARLIDDKLQDITVCDPAVGSGAFPVGMMTEIVRARFALTPYFNDVRERTPYFFKRHAIQNCLYGVDIDPGAVEIAKLRLWLSLVVDEEDVKQIKPLPNLDYKVVTGNSLIGFPFKSQRLNTIEELKQQFFEETDHEKKADLKSQIDEQLQTAFANSKRSLGYEVNFDFEIYFSEVFRKNGGFDVVIANPPYVSNKKMHKNKMQDEILIYKKLFFSMKSGNADIYVLFIEKSLSIIKKQGTIRLIIPNKFLIAKYSKAILNYIISNRHLTSIDDFSNVSVFENASVYPIIVELRKSVNTKAIRQLFTINDNVLQVLQQKAFDYKELTINKLQSTKEEQPLIDKIINQSIPLGNELVVSPGINGFQFTNYGKCIFEKSEKNLAQTKYKKLIISGSIDRYVIKDDPIRYNKRRLSDPVIVYDAKIISPGKWELFESPKIVIAGMATKIEAYYDEEGELASGVNVYSIFESKSLSFKYILSYLNSRLGSWLFRNLFYDKHLSGNYISINATLLKNLPIRIISITDQNNFAKLVDRILAAKRAEPAADTSKWERKIDGMVYELYGLTEDEIAIVEGESS